MADEPDKPPAKPAKAKKRQVRSYSVELAALQAEHSRMKARVEMAVRILRRAMPESTDDKEAIADLVEVAIETLTSE